MDETDRLALHELPGRYGDLVDDADWEGLSQIFVDDATFEVNGRLLDGLARIRTWMATEARHPLAHLMTNVYADETPEGVVLFSRVISMRPDGTINSGRYRDLVVKTPAGWRVKTRVFTSTPGTTPPT